MGLLWIMCLLKLRSLVCYFPTDEEIGDAKSQADSSKGVYWWFSCGPRPSTGALCVFHPHHWQHGSNAKLSSRSRWWDAGVFWHRCRHRSLVGDAWTAAYSGKMWTVISTCRPTQTAHLTFWDLELWPYALKVSVCWAPDIYCIMSTSFGDDSWSCLWMDTDTQTTSQMPLVLSLIHISEPTRPY